MRVVKGKMLTSACGTKDKRGFTLVEITAVLFILGLILWTVAPRLSRFGDPGRDAVFRELASGSEQAFNASLFEKKETRLVIVPSSRTFEFISPDRTLEDRRPRNLGSDLTITSIRIAGLERPLDLPTEIRFLPGGRVSDAQIRFRDDKNSNNPTFWVLSLNPIDGSMKIQESTK